MMRIDGEQPERAPSRHFILGTAGHIDHGKTSLIKALTGTSTDRLPEEKQRGMTIELGFAELAIGATRFGVVDVPGHERFVRTMVAGATGVDLALLVVAADDSVMPQTIEHVEILQLLGVSRCVVALTKCDLVDSEILELVKEDIEALLADSALAGSPIVAVSSITGEGVDALKETIVRQTEALPARPAEQPFRMAIDRIFTVQGRGSVVTGSVLRGWVTSGETLQLLPGGETCRVRDMQSHGQASDSLAHGQRAALNISGLRREQIDRHMELATPGYLVPSRMMDVRLHCLPSRERPIPTTGIVRMEIGTTEVRARVVFHDVKSLAPGEWAYARLRAGQPITAAYGQRFIIRNENATRTIGGGIVLRPQAHRRRRALADQLQSLRRLDEGSPADRVEEVLRDGGFRTPSDLHICAQAGVELSELPAIFAELREQGRWVLIDGTKQWVAVAALEELRSRLIRWLERYHTKNPEKPGRHRDSVLGWLERIAGRSPARPLMERFIDGKAIKSFGAFACLAAFAPSLSKADERLLSAMIAEVRAGRFQPPSLESIGIASQADRKRWDRLATLAVATGDLVRIENKLYLHADVERELRTTVATLIDGSQGVSVAQVREAISSSRKFVVPFMEHLDRVGFTKRVGDLRVLCQPPKP